MEKLPSNPTGLATLLNISTPYASQLLRARRPWTKPLALMVYRKTGERVGPLSGFSDDEIEVLSRFVPERAA